MAYKDSEKKRAAWRAWYHRTKSLPEQKAGRSRRRKKAKDRRHAMLSAQVTSIKVNRGCLKCGIRHPAVLQFHHARGVKEFEIAVAVSSCFPWERILAEIEKCDVLCANCHMKTHPRRPPKVVPRRVRGKYIFDEEA